MSKEDGKRYYWLKLKRDFFKRHDIRIVEGMPNGKDYILFYLKLLVESIDHEGALRFSDTIPYSEEMLSIITDTNIDIVRSAMKIFTELHMIEVWDDATIFMAEAEKLIGSETAWAEKKRQQKKLVQLSNGFVRINAEMLRMPDGTTRYVDEKRYGGNGMFVLSRANGKCEICGSDQKVVIHHNNGYSNDPKDLICLCTKCHGKAHSKYEGGIVPPPVPPSSTFCPPDVRQEIEKEKEKDIEIDKDISKDKPTKRVHGTYKHVRLTDAELERLITDYGQSYIDGMITTVDEYCQLHGKTYKDYNLAIRTFIRNDLKKSKAPSGKSGGGEYIITDKELADSI